MFLCSRRIRDRGVTVYASIRFRFQFCYHFISFHFNLFQSISSRFNSFQFSDFDGMSIRVILIHPNSIPLNSIDICRLRDRDAQSSEQQPMGLPSSGTPAKNWDSQRPVQHNQRDSLTPGLADCRTKGLPLTGTPGFLTKGLPPTETPGIRNGRPLTGTPGLFSASAIS